MASEPTIRSDAWRDDEGDLEGPAARASFRTLTREEAQALRERQPTVSPWRVVGVQAGLGLLVAGCGWLLTGREGVLASALYGAAAVVVPGALMARGMTSRFSSMSPGTSAVSFMLWELVKIAVSVAMLVMAPRVVRDLSWPALLVAMVLCMKVYWLALAWRGR